MSPESTIRVGDLKGGNKWGLNLFHKIARLERKNRNVDTEEEVELVLRLFPEVFMQTHCFLVWLTSCAQAVTFVPLFLKLGAELSLHYKQIERQVTTATRYIPSIILRIDDWDWDCPEVCDSSLSVLARLIKEKYDVEETKAFAITESLLSSSEHRGMAFVEAKIRFLIDWMPEVLSGDGPTIKSRFPSFKKIRYQTCLEIFLSSDEIENNKRNLRIFEVLVELGMFHYPRSLGFAFHERNLDWACYYFDVQQVKQIVHGKLGSVALKQFCKGGSTRNDFLIENSREWSADAVYMVIRYDPIGVLYR